MICNVSFLAKQYHLADIVSHKGADRGKQFLLDVAIAFKFVGDATHAPRNTVFFNGQKILV
jgi:hypothetical protein